MVTLSVCWFACFSTVNYILECKTKGGGQNNQEALGKKKIRLVGRGVPNGLKVFLSSKTFQKYNFSANFTFCKVKIWEIFSQNNINKWTCLFDTCEYLCFTS